MGTVPVREAKVIFERHPWQAEIDKQNAMDHSLVEYQPSVKFTETEGQRSFELTAEAEGDKYMFAIWYERPVKKKVLFGLLGEKMMWDSVDSGLFTTEEAGEILSLFVAGEYEAVEDVVLKKH